MTTQPSLFGPPNQYGDITAPAPSRATDPQTSHLAGERHAASGKLHGHAALVLRLLQANPGSTFSELFAAGTSAERAELVDDKEVCRRLDTLKKLNLARRLTDESGNNVTRACRVTGSSKTVWVAVELREHLRGVAE